MILPLVITLIALAALIYLRQRALKESIGLVMLGWLLTIAFFAGLWAAVFFWMAVLR